MVRSSVFGFISILLVFSVKYEQVNGQDSPLTTWLNVGRAVANDFVDLLGDIPIPLFNNMPQSPPAVVPTQLLPSPMTPPTPRIVSIDGKPFITFDAAPAVVPAPAPTPSRDAWNTMDNPLWALYNFFYPTPAAPAQPSILPSIFFPPVVKPPTEHQHHGPCHHGCGCSSKTNKPCQPERVRIVVVDDCEEKKSSSEESSSDSSESKSHEVDVVVPRHGHKTINYRVRH